MKESNSTTDPIGQNLIKLISNVCFSVFVFTVLIFTVIAITYQPPDPWESSRALTRVFTQVKNATFQTDSSILKTGEDMTTAVAATPEASPNASMDTITEAVIEKSEEKLRNLTVRSDCEDLFALNCSDPRVLIAIEKFNLKTFKSIVFLEYQTPVNGSRPSECDVAWRFRNKKDKSWRKYRDFRRFRIGHGENCTFKVINARGWHSGINARRPRNRFNMTKSGENAKVAPLFRDDEINDTIPVLGSDMVFRKGKYLYYSRGGDYCKGMNHYLWSFLCALGEAQYLNRTLVMDLSICLAATYTGSKKDEEGKDFRFYFDFEHLKEEASIVEEGEFVGDWKKWDKAHKKKIPVRKVASSKVTPMQLKKDKSTIIWRQFDAPEPDNYWYRVCEGQAAKYIERPWHTLWKSKRLMNIVSEISGRMDWDFDAVHVVRGEKAQNKELWPHLDADTSPDALVPKLQGMVQPWRNLYIATNEPFYNYFDKLRSHYKVHLLDDYKELWGNTSEWYNETRLLNGGRPVDFDGYMRVEVDTEVLYRAKTRVETFYNLTSDCKDGINTC
ncbi:Rab proteins geranylgeranyltransferase component A 2 like [Actinidia chinensis var. chinensis]|uniref:Rab proteins geranylgeranyltransferase component A 2 like n=1 Tax=Actinidia chinensis var. chinensis TaxID=1590841 RepID=A0A2R6QTQ8_ACTCC|nr:Rab proteins geranylgeranyltransferase component A 2 like [Actinidia chinensis var. chinensis]